MTSTDHNQREVYDFRRNGTSLGSVAAQENKIQTRIFSDPDKLLYEILIWKIALRLLWEIRKGSDEEENDHI